MNNSYEAMRGMAVNGTAAEPKPKRRAKSYSLCELISAYPRLKPPLIDGLLRRGEVGNLISVSKIGKSWLIYNLIVAITQGLPWLGRFPTKASRVLLIDCELHPETLAGRLLTVCGQTKVDPALISERLEVIPVRGLGWDLTDLMDDLEGRDKDGFDLLVIDPKYRLARPGQSENDNATETQFYNDLDGIAADFNAAVLVVHHSTKGNQSEKRVTDVGAGAGAQSRAADTHIVLREHEEPDTVVLDAALRSFPPVKPLAIRWEYPLWIPSEEDPALLKAAKAPGQLQRTNKDTQDKLRIMEMLRQGPRPCRSIWRNLNMGHERAERLLHQLAEANHISTRQDGKETLYEVIPD